MVTRVIHGGIIMVIHGITRVIRGITSLVPSVMLHSDSGIPFHSTLSAFLECDTLHSVEWNACCNMHSIPWSECVRTHSRHIPLFEFSRFKRFRG